MSNKGFIQILPVLVIGVIILATTYLFKNESSSFLKTISQSPTPTPIPISTPTLTPTPTLIPTPSLTPTPTLILTPTLIPTPTPTPTPKPVSGPPGSGYSSITVATPKGNFAARVLSISLGSTRVITDTANDSDCSNDCPVLTLQDFVNRNGGFAGVNGSYFCPATYPDCTSKKNVFDFPVFNSRLSRWINAGNLFWDSRAMVYFDGVGAHYLQNAKDFGSGATAGIVNYPGLLNGGNIQIDENQSGLSDKQRIKGTKVGIGLRGNNNVMVVIANNVNMQEFANVFKSLGADSALNLDTGGSTALYYNGRYMVGPGRNIPNAIIFAR